MKNRYVAFVKWGKKKIGEQFIEEIDVDAKNDRQARKYVREILKKEYEPGGRIHKLIMIEKVPGVQVLY